MKKALPLIFVAFLAAFLGAGCSSLASAQEVQPPTPPNIVYIVTDEMNEKDLEWMPKTKSLIFEQGIKREPGSKSPGS